MNPNKRNFMLGDIYKSGRAYSHATCVDVGDSTMIFIAGQIAKNEDGEPTSNDIQEQTTFIFEKIKRILEENNSSLDDLVKVQIFLKDIKNFEKVSVIRNQYLETSKPVSTLIEMGASVKEGCDVEIDGIAITKINIKGKEKK